MGVPVFFVVLEAIMYDTQLGVINACLATMGEAPLGSLQTEHTYKQAAQNYLDGSNRARQKTGLWFNTEIITLVPEALSKFVYLPQDAIHTARLEGGTLFSQRGKRLYDPLNNTYLWQKPVQLIVVRLIPFEDCPFFAQDAIALDAILRFQREYDGDRARYEQIDRDRSRANIELNAEHIRSIQPNLLRSLNMQYKMRDIHRYNYTSGPALGLPGRQ